METEEITFGSEEFITATELARRAILKDRKDLLEHAIGLGVNWGILIKEAAFVGNQDLIKFILDRNPDYLPPKYDHWRKVPEGHEHILRVKRLQYYDALQGALKGKHWQLCEEIIADSPKEFKIDHDPTILYPSDRETYTYVLSRFHDITSSTINSMAYGVLCNGDKQAFEDLRMLYPSEKWRWSSLGEAAAVSGNISLFEYIDGLSQGYNWTWAVLGRVACRYGHKDMFLYLYSRAPEDCNWAYSLCDAAKSGHFELFELVRSMIPEGAKVYWSEVCGHITQGSNISTMCEIMNVIPEIDWECLIRGTIDAKEKWICHKVLSWIPKDYSIHWNDIMRGFINDIDEFEFTLSVAPYDYQWDIKRLREQIYYDDMKEHFCKLTTCHVTFESFKEKLSQGEIKKYRVNKLLDYRAAPENVIMTFWHNDDIYNCEVRYDPQNEEISSPV